MIHHSYISVIAVWSVVSFCAWLLVLFRLNPYEAPGVSLLLFFLSFLIFLTSFFTILGFYFRAWYFSDEIFYRHLTTALRQGFFLAILVNFSLLLQIIRSLNWWSGLLLVLIFILIEAYFSAKESEELI